eukprot:1071678-Amphidinium_carterae.1
MFLWSCCAVMHAHASKPGLQTRVQHRAQSWHASWFCFCGIHAGQNAGGGMAHAALLLSVWELTW